MARFLALLALLFATAAAPLQQLPGLTILPGETWIFRVEQGQPAGARKTALDSAPASGEIKVSLARDHGMVMVVTNNSEERYAYRAFISVKAGHKGNRVETCPLAPGGQTVEQWPEPFPAIRLADFTEAPDGEMRCE